MSKLRKTLSILVAVALVVTLLTPAAFAADNKVQRVAGENRYETSADIALDKFDSAETVIIVNGEDRFAYADGLAASVLAGALDAPILLTDANELSDAVADAIEELGASKAYILGGTTAVSKAVEEALEDLDLDITRLDGENRYETAALIAEEADTDSKTAYVVNGWANADAMVAGAAAFNNGNPILLVEKDNVRKETADALKALGIENVIIVGGTSVVSAAVANELDKDYDVKRIAGEGRYETSAVFAKETFNNPAGVSIVNGWRLADAIGASVYGNPILYANANGNVLDKPVENYLDELLESNQNLAVTLFGGPVALSNALQNAIQNKIDGEVPAELKVESISAINLNQIEVKFSQEVDKTTAELVTNYRLDGGALPPGSVVKLLSDNKTAIITLNSAEAQQAKKYVTVEGVFNKDITKLVPKTEIQVTFGDVTAPKASEVKVIGNKRLEVKFSEAVNLDGLNTGNTGILINGTTLTSMGIDSVTPLRPTNSNYSDTLVLTFNSALPAGTNKLKVPADKYYDAAGFGVAETELNFTVENITTAPKVLSVKAENGAVIVTFDREMDRRNNHINGAMDPSNYELVVGGGNANVVADDVQPVVSGKYDKLELTFSSGLSDGANTLIIKKDVQDAWGNVLDEENDIRVSFTKEKDTVKPTVLNVFLTRNDSTETKITVKFSEKVNYSYATTLSNYKLKDSSGKELPITTSEGWSITNSKTQPSTVADDTYILTKDNQAVGSTYGPLNQSSYTLEIKNIIDLASNRMDDTQKTISVNDTIAPTAVRAYYVDDANDNSIVIEYNEQMSDSVYDKANYYYNDGSWKSLPSAAKILSVDGNKVVKIEFPSSVNKNNVNSIRITGVKDQAGNLLRGGAAELTVQNPVNAGDVTVERTSVKAYANSSKVWVTFETSSPLSQASGMLFGPTTNLQTPDSVTISNKTVTLNFTTKSKMDVIKAAGRDAYLSNTGKTNANRTLEGRLLEDLSGANSIRVYEDHIAPEILAVTKKDDDEIDITFTEVIDDTIRGLYNDDFVFEKNGKILRATATDVVLNRVTYTINSTDLAEVGNDVINVKVTPVEDKIDIRDVRYPNGVFTKYAPSTADKNGRLVTMETADYDNVQAVINAIAALPEPDNVTVADAVAINAAQTSFNKLAPALQALVTNKAKLDAVVAALVINQIAALPDPVNVTLGDQTDIESARLAYDNLTATQKALVTNENRLQDIEQALVESVNPTVSTVYSSADLGQTVAIDAVTGFTFAITGSSDTNVIDNDGKIAGVGTADLDVTVTHTTSGKTATKTVTVNVNP